jgi:hypothetical protein
MIMAACIIPGRPVLPILFKYRYKHFNAGWGIVNVYWHIYRLMTQFINHCEVIAGASCGALANATGIVLLPVARP